MCVLWILDDTCILLPTHTRTLVDHALRQRITGALCTRFKSVTAHALRQAIPEEVDEWGKVRILNDGDTIRAAALDTPGEDSRDATFVRVSLGTYFSVYTPICAGFTHVPDFMSVRSPCRSKCTLP